MHTNLLLEAVEVGGLKLRLTFGKARRTNRHFATF